VKGRSEVTTIFGVAGDAEYAQASEFSEWRRANDEMLAAYRSGQVARAHSLARTLCGSVPSDWCAVYQSMADRLADLVSTKERSDLDTVRVLEKL
jgi:hypothetical protein